MSTPAKGVGLATGTRVQISLAPPLKNKLAQAGLFLYILYIK